MEGSIRKCIYVLLMCVLTESAAAFNLPSSSLVCQLDFKTFLHDLEAQCPFQNPLSSSPIEVDGESFVKAMTTIRMNEYTAVLFYASWCPFSSIFQSKFSTLSSMYPQIKHIMVEQSSAMPSVFSKYGIHSVPSLLIVNQTTRMRHHGRKDLPSLISFYKRTTGLEPMVDIIEETPSNPESGAKGSQHWNGASLKETFSREPYLFLAVVFVLSRALLYFFPDIVSRLLALWAAYIPHLNLGVLEESRQLLAQVLQMIDLKKIWSKLKICKTWNFHNGATKARVWASSLASVSLGETYSSRGL